MPTTIITPPHWVPATLTKLRGHKGSYIVGDTEIKLCRTTPIQGAPYWSVYHDEYGEGFEWFEHWLHKMGLHETPFTTLRELVAALRECHSETPIIIPPPDRPLVLRREAIGYSAMGRRIQIRPMNDAHRAVYPGVKHCRWFVYAQTEPGTYSQYYHCRRLSNITPRVAERMIEELAEDIPSWIPWTTEEKQYQNSTRHQQTT
jgi:hypothetical protein